MPSLISTEPILPAVVLVALRAQGDEGALVTAHLEELAALAHTCGLRPIKTFTQQLPRPYATTWVGQGKLEEIATFVKEQGAAGVVFDGELTAAQVKHLSKLLACQIWDRSLLILEIFSKQAQTAQARKQVALAHCQYLLPRLKGMWPHLSRQRGGVRMRGAGETESETDRRLVQKKIYRLQQALAAIERQTATQRQQRATYVKVSLVGYTNAGKSTLMNTLAKAAVKGEDRLFATLSTTVRKARLRDIPFLLADTVGFIRDLPHTLIRAFHATLTEVREADLLLHVADFSHPQFESQIEVVNKTLQEINAHKIPLLLVLNKCDKAILAEGEEAFQQKLARYQAKYKGELVAISALEKGSLAALQALLYKYVKKRHQEIYPHNQPGVIASVAGSSAEVL